jgi:arylsulfatase A-like enzyme
MVMWGKDIVRGRELPDASVLDITPTVLALWGLPVGEDMDGRVLTDAIEPSFLKAHPVRTIPTHEDAVKRQHSDEPIESPVDDEIRERMKALGYIG